MELVKAVFAFGIENTPPPAAKPVPERTSPIPASVVLAPPPAPMVRQIISKSRNQGASVTPEPAVMAALDQTTPAALQVVEVSRRIEKVKVGVAVVPSRPRPLTRKDLPVPP